MRIHELAKQLGMTSADLLARIKKLGGSAKSHMSVVDEETLSLIQGKLGKAQVPAGGQTANQVAADKLNAGNGTDKAGDGFGEEETGGITPSAEGGLHTQGPVSPVGTREGSPRPAQPAAAVAQAVRVEFPITVGNLAVQLNIKIPELIKSLMTLNVFANVNQLLNDEIVFAVAGKLGIAVEKVSDKEQAGVPESQVAEDPKLLMLRPPVVTLMGHVDHGKTSLLDAIRKTNVAGKEKGFITQHIGAYGVNLPGRGHVTFLDTPGHEAFTAMRARGANVTDVVVLVVAADDGVMPQTIEAIDHAREAGCPIVVAVNKIDLPVANPQKVMAQLQKIGIVAEEWGGKSIFVKVSAKTGEGIDTLLEMLLLEAEVLELKANPNRLGAGAVIESHLSKGSGPVATVIVQKGTLHIGDMVVSGPFMGRVRSLRNDRGKSVKEAGPSYAAELSGLNGVPEAGETFMAVEDEKTARRITDKRQLELRERAMRGASKHLSLEELYHRISEGNFKELKIIIKADVQGSIEALAQSLETLSTDTCRVRVIHGGAGGINESDIMLAAASEAIILGFHVKADPKAQMLADREGAEIRFYNIIYEAVEDVRKAMEGLLEPTYREVLDGKIQVRKVFESSRIGTIGGGVVIKGKVLRSNSVRLIRDNIVIFDGKLNSLRRFKDDVREVLEGYECGFALEGFNDVQENDTLEAYHIEKTATKL